MLYNHLELWNKDDNIWHALYTPGTRDLSMGVSRFFEVDKMIKWAKSQGMTIIDKRLNGDK